MLTIETFPLGPIQTNCYIISHDETKQCVIVDPGEEAETVIRYIESNGFAPLAILLTHAHFDHIGAVDPVRNRFNIPVYLHEEEEEWLYTPSLNGSGKYTQLPDVVNGPADHVIREEGSLSFGPLAFDVLHTPGHSPGSVTYVLKGEGVAFVGDVLFRQSIGRTDLVGGSMEQLLESIHTKLMELDESTIVYPGHGPLTTLEMEQEDNPFLNGFS